MSRPTLAPRTHLRDTALHRSGDANAWGRYPKATFAHIDRARATSARFTLKWAGMASKITTTQAGVASVDGLTSAVARNSAKPGAWYRAALPGLSCAR